MKIGSKYEEEKKELVRKINSGSVFTFIRGCSDFENTPICYFCVKKIEDPVIVLDYSSNLTSGFPMEKTKYSHEDCFLGCLERKNQEILVGES